MSNEPKLRCKPGDLAMIIKEESTKGLVGRLVIVRGRVHDGDNFPSQEGVLLKVRDDSGRPMWECQSATSEPLPVYNKSKGIVHHVLRRPIYDEFLMPITATRMLMQDADKVASPIDYNWKGTE